MLHNQLRFQIRSATKKRKRFSRRDHLRRTRCPHEAVLHCLLLVPLPDTNHCRQYTQSSSSLSSSKIAGMEALPGVMENGLRESSLSSDPQPVYDPMNIATMSDSQFSKSLDALIDIPFDGDDTMTPSPLPPNEELSTLLDSSTEFEKPSEGSSEGEKVASIVNQSSSLETPEPTNIFQSTAAPSFVMPILPGGFEQSAYFAPTGNFVPVMTQPFAMANSMGVFSQPLVGGSASHSFPTATLSYFPYGTMTNTTHVAPMAVESSSRKREHMGMSTFPISEDESDLRKRKADRNAREQQRAQQVTDQIAHLRAILERSGVSLSKTDKFSTLVAVEDYITSLQTKAMELTREHENLLSTIQQTTEFVNSQYIASSVSTSAGTTGESGSEESRPPESSDQDEESENDSAFVQGINYKWIFDCCPFAVGIASIDGRFIDCNTEFQELTGYSRAELLPLGQGNVEPVLSPPTDAVATNKKKRNMSIFNVLHRECIERLFCAMSKILQKSVDDDDGDDANDESISGYTITHEVNLCKRTNRKVPAVAFLQLVIARFFLTFRFFLEFSRQHFEFHFCDRQKVYRATLIAFSFHPIQDHNDYGFSWSPVVPCHV